jgi:hypothetical protein
MSTVSKRRGAGRWVAGLTVVVALLGLAVLFRPLAKTGAPARSAAVPRVSIAPLERAGDSLMRDQATFFDPTPLFLPTEWNTNQRPLPATVQRQPGQVFPDFGSKLTYGEAELTLPVASVRSFPLGPADLLRVPSRDPFLGFDREDVALTPLPARQGFVEVRKAGTGEMVLAQNLEGDVILPASQPDWQPAEFLVSVTVTGMLGRPVETVSSDLEDVDVFFRDYLAKTLHLGERLPPGIYRVVVGP